MWGHISRSSRRNLCARLFQVPLKYTRCYSDKSSCCDDHNPQAQPTQTLEDVFRDHRQLGVAQDLFMINPLTPGSVFFLPHGTRVFNKLVEFMRAQLRVFGFDEVVSPIIYRKGLWETSGHWDQYQEDMFQVSAYNDEAKEVYGLKPMNCPGHCMMYRNTDRSYRDLPIRFADFSPLHRNEASGALTGLTRVRRFHQDDGHIFCRPDQVAHEINSTIKLVDQVYKVFGMPSYRLLLSTRPEQYIGSLDEWNKAEDALRSVLSESGKEWTVNESDGAFYGPKIDIVMKDLHGKEHQAATIQLDFQLPQRFDLKYRTEDPNITRRPVMVHRAVFGSVERFMAILIEQNQGKWPFWLSPRQMLLIPISDKHVEYAKKVQHEISGIPEISDRSHQLNSNAFYVDIDDRTVPMGTKLRDSYKKGYNYVGVVGNNELLDGTVALRAAGNKNSMILTPSAIREMFITKSSRYE
ncbi:hypothetical protein V1511DRAFT_498502 [Dipodascopsis uninucleata]